MEAEDSQMVSMKDKDNVIKQVGAKIVSKSNTLVANKMTTSKDESKEVKKAKTSKRIKAEKERESGRIRAAKEKKEQESWVEAGLRNLSKKFGPKGPTVKYPQ